MYFSRVVIEAQLKKSLLDFREIDRRSVRGCTIHNYSSKDVGVID